MPIWLLVIGLFLLAFVFILIEAFIIPGFGLGGILGFFSLCAACYLAFTQLAPVFGWLTTIGSFLLLFGFFKWFPHTAAWKKIRLNESEHAADGFQSANTAYAALLNKTGKAITMLRPSGVARIEGNRYDVITDSEFIDENEPIVVAKVEGNKIIVKKLDTGEQSN